MKNVIQFSTFRPSKSLCLRMQKKVGFYGKLGYISAWPGEQKYCYKHGHIPFHFAMMGFSDMAVYPIGFHYNRHDLDNLLKCDAIAIGGGNTFELLYMLQTWNLIPVLHNYATEDGILMGESAGGIVQCPSARIALFADDNYLELDDLKSLNLVSYEVKPHWDFWKQKRHLFSKYVKETGALLYGLSEGQAIWETSNGRRFYGGMPEVVV